MWLYGESSPSYKRYHAIQLWLEGELSVAEIVCQVGISRASFYVYRWAYLERGVAGLNGRGRGRPHKSASLPLEAAVMEGLRRMRWFHLPTLRHWVKHQGGNCTDWTLRRMARQSIAMNRFEFSGNWRERRAKLNNISVTVTDARQTLLDLKVVESSGLKAWYDLPADDFMEWQPYMRQGQPLTLPTLKW